MRKRAERPNNSTRTPTRDSGAAGYAMALLRIFVGGQLLQAGFRKWSWIGTMALHNQVVHWLQGPASAAEPRYASFLWHAVLPQCPLFTYLVVIGELSIGVLLTLGLLTRLASLVLLFIVGNYLLATWNGDFTIVTLNETFVALSLALLISGAGRTFGLDADIARKRPRWILW